MFVTFYSIFVVLLGLALYIIRPKWLLIYWLIMFPILFPFINLGFMIYDRELFHNMYNATQSGLRNLFVLLVFIELCKRKFVFPKLGNVYLGFAGISIYLLLHNLLQYPNYMGFPSKIIEVINLILPLIFLVIRKDLCPPISSLYKVIGLVLFLQLIGLIINNSGYYVYPTFYIPYVTILANGMAYDDSILTGGSMGFFPTGTMASNFLATIYFFISLEYFSGKHFSGLAFYFLTLLIGSMILLSGIRVSLILFFFSFLLGNLMYVKHHLKIFLIVISLSLSSLVFLLSVDITTTGQLFENESIDRQVTGLASFLQSKKDKDDDHSTFNLTPYLLENYFLDGFLIGNGRESRGEFAYGNVGIVTLENFQSDAKVAYILVEYGLLGFCFYFFFFSAIIGFLRRKLPSKERAKISACFLFYFIMTIVDQGLFDRFLFVLLYIYCLSVLLNNNSNCIFNRSLSVTR